MRQKDIQRLGLNQIPDSKHSRAGIKNNTQLRQHHARRLAMIVGVIAGRT